jgi:PKD repeat protein
MQNSEAAYRVGYQLFGVGGNQMPVAVAGADVLVGDVPLTVNFNSTGTTDPDGSVVSYLWDFGDGTTATGANPSHTYVIPADYAVTLTVTDNEGATTSNGVGIAAQPPNIAPIAISSANVTAGSAPLSVVFSAAGSYDPDGSIGNIHWDFDDGGSIYWGSPAYHTFSSDGLYKVTLTVYDGRGATGTTTLYIAVGNVTIPPVVGGGMSSGTDLMLSWTDNPNNCGYEIYESTSPYFTASGVPYQVLPAGSTSSMMTGVLGDVNNNYHYIVRALGCASTFADSKTIGEFDFAIEAGN